MVQTFYRQLLQKRKMKRFAVNRRFKANNVIIKLVQIQHFAKKNYKSVATETVSYS